jgi:hypothetical protein
MPLAFILTLSVGYFPFALMDGGIAGQIPGYIGSDWEEFNAGLRVGLRYLLSWLVSEQNPWMYANAAGLLLLGGFLLLCAHALIRSDHDVRGVPARAAMLLGGWLLLAMPSAEPWYAWGLMALTAITLSPAWIWFSGALGLTYLKYVEVSRTLPTWLLVIEYVPTLLLLGYAAGRSAALKSNARGPARDDWPRPLPPSDQRWIKLPLYLVGVFPVIAILIALYFLLS